MPKEKDNNKRELNAVVAELRRLNSQQQDNSEIVSAVESLHTTMRVDKMQQKETDMNTPTVLAREGTALADSMGQTSNGIINAQEDFARRFKAGRMGTLFDTGVKDEKSGEKKRNEHLVEIREILKKAFPSSSLSKTETTREKEKEGGHSHHSTDVPDNKSGTGLGFWASLFAGKTLLGGLKKLIGKGMVWSVAGWAAIKTFFGGFGGKGTTLIKKLGKNPIHWPRLAMLLVGGYVFSKIMGWLDDMDVDTGDDDSGSMADGTDELFKKLKKKDFAKGAMEAFSKYGEAMLVGMFGVTVLGWLGITSGALFTVPGLFIAVGLGLAWYFKDDIKNMVDNLMSDHDNLKKKFADEAVKVNAAWKKQAEIDFKEQFPKANFTVQDIIDDKVTEEQRTEADMSKLNLSKIQGENTMTSTGAYSGFGLEGWTLAGILNDMERDWELFGVFFDNVKANRQDVINNVTRKSAMDKRMAGYKGRTQKKEEKKETPTGLLPPSIMHNLHQTLSTSLTDIHGSDNPASAIIDAKNQSTNNSFNSNSEITVNNAIQTAAEKALEDMMYQAMNYGPGQFHY